MPSVPFTEVIDRAPSYLPGLILILVGSVCLACIGQGSDITICALLCEPDPTMSEAPAQPVICVVGMHRSGTSCLVGSLQNAGLELGRHHTENRYNKRGNRENPDIVAFNDSLLADNSTDWEQPPLSFSYDPAQVQAARALAADLSGEGIWGFKDPRTLLVLPLWLEALPAMRLVGIFRHPQAVAASLQHRHGSRMTETMAYEIWYQYNLRLLQALQDDPFPLLNFDWEIELFHEKLNQVIVSLGLQALAPDQRFYTADLHNNTVLAANEAAIKIPDKLTTLYRQLNELTL